MRIFSFAKSLYQKGRFLNNAIYSFSGALPNQQIRCSNCAIDT